MHGFGVFDQPHLTIGVLFHRLGHHAKHVVRLWVRKLFGFFLCTFIQNAGQVHCGHIVISHLWLPFARGHQSHDLRS